MTYWPWWLGALALGLITVAHPLWTGRSFGMSGAWSRVVTWRESRDVDRLDAQFASVDLRAALAVSTAEQFGSAGGRGPTAGQTVAARPVAPVAPVEVGSRAGARSPRMAQRPLSVVFSAVLLGSVFVGGLLASVTSGRFELRTDMGPGFRDVVTGDPVWMSVVLFVGGLMVGFGTRMAGGCTSGHGLTGCSRLHPVSLVATATFFGTAVVVSFLLWKVI